MDKRLGQLIVRLYTAQVLFIALTPLALYGNSLAIAWPLLFTAVLALLGRQGASGMTVRPALPALIAGAAAQLPGIISALVILKGIASGYTTPDAFDFTIQMWYAPFTPLFALLPRLQYGGVPLYFVTTLALPFIMAPVPACGALLARRRRSPGQPPGR